MIFSTGPIVKIGYFSKTHGYEGKLKLVHDSKFKIKMKEPIFVFIDEKPVPFFFDTFQPSNPVLCSLNGISTYDAAKIMVGKDVFITGDPEMEAGDLNLIGYQITDRIIGEIGTIKSVVNNGAQQLAIVDYREVECMIPIVDAFFVKIDHLTKQIEATLPDGLLDLSNASSDVDDSEEE